MAGRHRVEELEHRCHELKEQQKLLETARSQLCARERLLNAWCGALCLLKDLGVIDVDSSQRCEELEQRLQRELSKISAAQPSDAHHHDSSANAAVRRNNCNSSCGTTNNNSISRELVPDCAHEGYATIAPAADPIAYMRKLLQQPVLTAAATMTSAEMAALQRECVLQSGVHSQLLHMSESPAQQALAIEKIAGIWDRYFHALLSLYLHGRLHVAEAMAVYNLETLKADPEGAVQHESLIERRMHQLQLTPQQQEAITVGADLYAERMKHILLQRQQVQSRPAWCTAAGAPAPAAASAAAGTAGGGAAAAAGGAAAGSQLVDGDGDTNMQQQQQPAYSGGSNLQADGRCLSCQPDSASRPGTASPSRGASPGSNTNPNAQQQQQQQSRLYTLHDRQLEMDAAQAHANRLQQLLEEEAQLRIITWGWLIGCLSWPQVAMLGTICWPFAQRTAVLGKAVHASWHEQNAKQQQQQQQQRQTSPGQPAQ